MKNKYVYFIEDNSNMWFEYKKEGIYFFTRDPLRAKHFNSKVEAEEFKKINNLFITSITEHEFMR